VSICACFLKNETLSFISLQIREREITKVKHGDSACTGVGESGSKGLQVHDVAALRISHIWTPVTAFTVSTQPIKSIFKCNKLLEQVIANLSFH
jgi:hypothetical protein